ncbi:MAG: hypothetical protein GC154_12170 [bacterium]|nr:hypothetical protein [bacterium]
MRVLFLTLPLALYAFTLPALQPSLRFTAFSAIALFVAFRFLISSPHKRSIWSSVILFLFVLLGGAAQAGVADAWLQVELGPSLMAGALIFVVWPDDRRAVWLGLILFAVLTWAILALPQQDQHLLFPAIGRGAQLNSAFVDVQRGELMTLIDSPAIEFPRTGVRAACALTASMLTTTLLFIGACSAGAVWTRNLWMVLLWIGCGLQAMLLGYNAAWLGAINAFFFFFFVHSNVWNLRAKAVLVLVGGALSLFAVWNPFNPLLSWTPLADVAWYWSAREALIGPGSGIAFWPSNLLASSPPFLISASAAALAIVLMVQQATRLDVKDPVFPAALSLISASILFTFTSPLSTLMHPCFWLGLALLHSCPLSTDIENGFSTVREHLHSWLEGVKAAHVNSILPVLSAGLAFFFVTASLNRIAVSRSFETGFESFFETSIVDERMRILDALSRVAPFRPDGAALFATFHLQQSIEQNVAPGDDLLQRIEIALNTCARYKVIPLLAYKRLSDIYLLKADSSRALLTFETAVTRFPESVVLRELYADLLDTMGRRNQALQQYQIASNLDPSAVRLREKIAMVYRSTGQQEKLDEELRKIETLSLARSGDSSL